MKAIRGLPELSNDDFFNHVHTILERRELYQMEHFLDVAGEARRRGFTLTEEGLLDAAAERFAARPFDFET
jgi:hypothetical protein